MDFSNIKEITITEGSVKKIKRGDTVLWFKGEPTVITISSSDWAPISAFDSAYISYKGITHNTPGETIAATTGDKLKAYMKFKGTSSGSNITLLLQIRYWKGGTQTHTTQYEASATGKDAAIIDKNITIPDGTQSVSCTLVDLSSTYQRYELDIDFYLED